MYRRMDLRLVRIAGDATYTGAVLMLAANVVALGAVAVFGARNCQFTTKADARHNVRLTTEPAIEPNASYLLADFSAQKFNRRTFSVNGIQ